MKLYFKLLSIIGLVAGLLLANPTLVAASIATFMFCQSYKQTGFAYTNPNLDIVGACERIIREAKALAGQNYAFNLQRKTGALDFITSPENGGVDAQLISRDGKITTLRVYYDQRTKPCEITHDCFETVCDEGATPVRKAFNFELSDCLKTKTREYSNDDMVALCQDTETFMRTRGFSDLRAAREKFSELILAEMVAQIGINHQFDGGNVAAGTYKTLDLVGTDNGQPIPLPGNFATIPLDYENNQLNGVPAVIGQGNFDLFWKLQGYSCCNATTPYGNANVESEVRYYKDQAANTILGTNRVIVATFGALHLVTFNENRNIVKTGVNSPDRFNIVIPDPAGYPFDWDLDFYFDNCTKTWKSKYSLQWGVFNVFQNDSFANNAETEGSPDCADELDGMLGVFGYNIT